MFKLKLLCQMLDEKREREKLSWRELAEKIGIPASSTFTRMNQGGGLPDIENLDRMIEWLEVPADTFFVPRKKKGRAPRLPSGPSLEPVVDP